MSMVTVAIRTYKRPSAVLELVNCILEQSYSEFELLILDQSHETHPISLPNDTRIRHVTSEPLGGPRSRNQCARLAKSEIIVLMDDDDLPGTNEWLSKLIEPLRDPLCLGVTGGDRLEGEGADERPYFLPWLAEKRVMHLDIFGWQRVHSRCRVSKKVDSLRGGNIAIRRTTLQRFGMWDECAPVEDDVSIAYRIQKGKSPNEYLFFTQDAYQIRRTSILGGMGKRETSARQYGEKVFSFLHDVVQQYYPRRFFLMYPAYLGLELYQVLDWIWFDNSFNYSFREKLRRTLSCAYFPVWHIIWFTGWLQRRRSKGKAPISPRLG